VISKEQAETAAQALLLTDASQSGKSIAQRRKATPGLLLGMSLGAVVGAACCFWLTGRFTPGQFVGQGLGAGLGTLVGLYLDRETSRRIRLLFAIGACSLAVIGAAPLVVELFLRK
jgi:hypothetical protein